MKTRTRLLVILISAIITSIIILKLNSEPVIRINPSVVNLDIGTNRPSPLPVPTPKR